MKTLTITDEAVKRAAEKYPAARELLKDIFPDVFEDKAKDPIIGNYFINGLAALMTKNKSFPYVLWKQIQGRFSEEKAKSICDLIIKTYWNETNF